MTASLDDEVVELRRANAELRQRLDEGLAREAATAEVLQVINSSPGDLVPVFDAILERAMRLCDAAYGQLHTFDGERFHPTAMRGEPRVVEWWRQVGPGAVAMCVGIGVGAISGWMRILDQAARSIDSSASFWVRVCQPSTLRMVI